MSSSLRFGLSFEPRGLLLVLPCFSPFRSKILHDAEPNNIVVFMHETCMVQSSAIVTAGSYREAIH